MTDLKEKVEQRADQIQQSQSRAALSERSIKLKELVTEARGHYDESEQSRKKGSLWVDRKSSKLIVTLGAINGLLPGHTLTVYDANKAIGQVIVDTAFDSISYVTPSNKSIDLLQNDYYHVIIE